MPRELKFIMKNKKVLLTLIIIALIPTLYISLFIGSFWNSYDKTGTLKVSIVNKDTGISKNNKPFNLGEDLSKELEKRKDLDFQLVSEKQALSNLKEGKSIGTILIPKDTSKHASEILEGKPHKVEIETQVNPAASYSASQIAKNANYLIVGNIEKQLRSKYLERIFDSMNNSRDGYKNISKNLGELSYFQNHLISSNQKLSELMAQNIYTPISDMEVLNKNITDGLRAEKAQIEKLKYAIDENTKNSDNSYFGAKNKEILNKPVEIKESNLSDINKYGEALFPYMGSVSLFLGAIAFSAAYPLRKQIKKGESTSKQILGKTLLYILQGSMAATLLSCLMIFLFKMHIENLFQFIIISVLWSIVSVSITSFLTLFLDKVGLFLSIVILILQLSSSEGVFPITLSDNFYQFINIISPMTYAVSGFRQSIYSGFLRYDVHFIIALFIIIIVVTIFLQFLVIKWFEKLERPPFQL
ncbi:YhgE/Pip domain-containing protein (plasmid) [Staphylococcus chromogenes]